jgi:gliding motility-associated-like protein
VIVNSVTGPTILLTLTGESCPGSCDGTALASATNGNPPYSFSWTPPGTPSTQDDSLVINLCSNFYSVRVVDSIGCVTVDTFSITSTGLNLSIINVIPESCFSACDGSATVVAGSISPSFTYQWNPSGGSNDVAVGLCVGNYTAVVTNASNCRDSIGTTITGPTILTVSIGINTPISCNGVCDGALIASPLGGTLPYTYLWSDGQTTQLATNLCAGTYWIRVTDGNGCTAYDTLVLDEPTPILANDTLFNPTCNVCDGVIQLIPSGGIGPYTYLWAAPIAPQNTPTVINLCADIYSVDITDFKNCTQTFTFVLDNIGAPDPNVTNTPVTCNGLCNASLVSSPTGGTGPYTYVWSPNANPPNINLFDSAITNLCPDIYDVRVTDSLGCVGISIDTIVQPAVLLANITSSNVTCFGINNGWAVVHPTGGTAPYDIAIWNTVLVADSISNLAPNTYYVSITDANGCTVTDSVIITEPALITATSSVIDASCTSACDGQTTLTVSGGTGTYTYSWNPSLQTTNPATNLCVGSYIVTIKDQNNCSVPVTVNVGSLDTVIAIAGNDVTVCAGTTVNLSGTAIGTVNSTQWLELPSMNVISNNNNVSVTSTMSGTICYVFKVIGPCNGFDTVCVTYNSQPIANAGIDVTILEGTTTQLNATGGGTYVWTPSSGLSDTTIANPIANPMITTTYYVTVTSDEGCTSTDSVKVTVIPTIRFPDGITPNGDGKNDTWVIDYIDQYPDHVVEIYNRWGELLYRSTDYKNDWNGTYNGENLPVGTYYYVIELNDGKTKPFTGPITVLR